MHPTSLHTHPSFDAPLAAFRAMIEGAATLPTVLPAGIPDERAARLRLENGIPALADEPLLDGAAHHDAMRHLVSVLPTGALPEREQFAATLAARCAPDDRERLAVAALWGDWERVSELARRLDLDEALFVTLADHAARPALRAAAARIDALLRDCAWPRSTCPACGAPPLLIEQRAGDEQRWLRCGRCAAAWRTARLACTACGERDHRRLRALHLDAEGASRRVECCDSCRGYIKCVATLSPLTPVQLIEVDVETVVLDVLAVERGYRR
jgi:formate dehydrogenase accessory protein FdhE